MWRRKRTTTRNRTGRERTENAFDKKEDASKRCPNRDIWLKKASRTTNTKIDKRERERKRQKMKRMKKEKTNLKETKQHEFGLMEDLTQDRSIKAAKRSEDKQMKK